MNNIAVSIVSDGTDFAALACEIRRNGVAVSTSWSGKIKSQIGRAHDSTWLIICEGGEYKLRHNRTGQSLKAPPGEISLAVISSESEQYWDMTPLAEALAFGEKDCAQFLELFPNASPPVTLKEYLAS